MFILIGEILEILHQVTLNVTHCSIFIKLLKSFICHSLFSPVENWKKSGNFAVFSQGKPGKVRELHLWDSVCTLSNALKNMEDKVLANVQYDLII